MNSLKNISLALCLFSLVGCSSVSHSFVSFDVLRPATYTLPTWTDTVVIVESVLNPRYSDATIDSTNEDVKLVTRVSQNRMPRQLCKALADEVDKSGYLKTALVYRHVGIGDRPSLLDSIFRGKQHTIVLMLQDLESSATIGVQDSHDEDGDAQKCASLICATSSTFSLVTSPSQSFPLSTRHDTLVYEACKPTLREVVANLPQISFRYRDLTDNVGVRTADMLIPVWQRVYRRIYVTTDPRSTAASSWVDKNKWQEARNLWVDIYMNDKSAPERVRAALNVALSYEREDDSQQAALWCSKALDLIEAASPDVMKSLASEQRHANAMFNYLVERMNQQATLDKQM